MITQANIWAQLKDQANNNVVNHLVGVGRPTNGTSGTGVGIAGKGSTYVNLSTGNAYLNTGTLASPAWENITGVRLAHATYDFAVDGGAIGLITPATNNTIPSGAIILGGIIDITTAFTSG